MISGLRQTQSLHAEERMVDIPGNTEWVADLIPDLAVRLDPFIVDTDELDDELVEIFTDEIQRLAGELKQGLDQGDGEAVRMAAHSIKGMGGTMGLPEISVLGLEVETLAKDERMEEAMPLVDGLIRWLGTFR
jgi:HPt (histidine-containing phosphotransfer) domain-containing protein